jgi:hypothetical protein
MHLRHSSGIASLCLADDDLAGHEHTLAEGPAIPASGDMTP